MRHQLLLPSCCQEDVTKIHTLSCRTTEWASVPHNHVHQQVVARNPRQRRTPSSIWRTRPTPFRQIHCERISAEVPPHRHRDGKEVPVEERRSPQG